MNSHYLNENRGVNGAKLVDDVYPSGMKEEYRLPVSIALSLAKLRSRLLLARIAKVNS